MRKRRPSPKDGACGHGEYAAAQACLCAANGDGGRLDRLQVPFLVHHRGQPCFAVGGDGVHDLVQQVPAEALSGVDVANLLAFGFRVASISADSRACSAW